MFTHQQPATSRKRKRNLKIHVVQNDSMLVNGQDTNVAKRIRRQETDPLKIGNILEQIFSNLDVESIKTARQVNPLWSVEGAKVLITKCYVKIPSAIRVGDYASRFKAVDEFKAFLSLKSSEVLTIPNITMDFVCDDELWKYFGVLGQQVTSLKINNFPSENDDEFFKNLLDLLPNLNYLKFKKLGYKPKIVSALASVMSTLEKNRGSLVISSLNLYPINLKQLEDVEKFADCKNIMIEELEFKFATQLHGVSSIETRIYNMLGKLLSTSQNSLKKLVLHNCHLILPLLEFPCMTALTYIQLFFYFTNTDQLPICKFSPAFRFSEKVPKLQCISFYGNLKQEISNHCFTNLFQTAGIAPSVKKVYFWGNVSDFDIYHVFKTFPNMQFLRTNVSQQSHTMLRSLWKHGKNLKELSLDVDLYPPLAKIEDLDTSFTGLSAWAVEEIKKAPNLNPFTLEELEGFRIDSSILKLKELENVQLHFHGNDRARSYKWLTVALKFAFNLLPKHPKIDIRVKNWTSRKEVKRAFKEVSKLPNVVVSCHD